MEDKYYPDYDDSDFNRILDKYEFQEQEKRKFVYQDPRQLMLRNLISKNTIYDNILLYWTVGTGKCHKIDTPIIMYDGTIKKIQDIQVGELIMGDDSTPRTVLNLVRGEDTMYEIIPTKGESHVINSQHILTLKYSSKPVLINNKYNSVMWFDTCSYKAIKKNFKCKNDATKFLNNKLTEYSKHQNICDIPLQDYLKLPKRVQDNLKCIRTPLSFSEKPIPFDPYILGYWLGNDTNRESSLTIQESTVLYYMTQYLPQYDLYLSKKQNTYNYGITGNSKHGDNTFLNTLKKYNLTNIKHIPHIYKCNSRENRLKLLAGILDADGYLDTTKTHYEICQLQKHEKLMDDIIYICRSLGFACYKKEKPTSWTHNDVNNTGLTWIIHISGYGLEEIPTLSPRKKAIPRKQKKDVLVSRFTVKKLEKDSYYGFTIDKNHRYILGDFTVTHNSCASITISEGFKEYVNNMGRKILVLVKNGNIEKNFKNELLSDCSNKAYLTELQEQFLKSSKDQVTKKELMNKITRKINKVYNFMTYGTFVNQILGMKEFEKDSYGRNTTKQIRNADGTLSRKRPTNAIENLNNTVIIIDEAHNITNNDVYIALSKILKNSYNYRLVLLTATPMYDNPKEIIEISNLLNMNNPDKILPIRNDLFKSYENDEPLMTKQNSKYLSDGILKSGLTSISEKGKDILVHNLKGKISYLQSNTDTFPDKIDMGESLLRKTGSINVVNCYMSKYQNDIYQKALKLDSHEQLDIDAEILDAEDNTEEYISISKSSSLYKNSSDASTMTYPNGGFGKDGFLSIFNQVKGSSDYKISPEYNSILLLDGELKKYSSKLATLLENINKSPGNVFIYSNYVNYGGTSLIKQLFLANGYTQFKGKSKEPTGKSFILYDDSTNVETREAQRKIFNSEDNKTGKYIKIIIGSPVISEGITLKNVRQVHILEPAWNMSRINQIIGRAVRHHSHDSLPEDQRNVEIYKYCSVYKTSNPLYFIDKEKYILAEEKDRSNKVVERLLKQIAFDCNINTQTIRGENNSAECDYTDCKYTCLIKPPRKEIDKFTYNLYINFFEEFDIELIISLIKDMFKKYFIYSVSDIIRKIKDLESIISNESIYNALKNIIDNKTILLDQYEREGFLIEKGDYIIFNPIDIDINSSIYAKTLDFTINTNEYNLHEYIKSKFDKNIDIESEIKEKTQKSKKGQEKIQLSDEDIKFNKKVMKQKIYGSYRERATKESGGFFGPYDGKFRIIDIRNITTDEEDKRKNISGMAATSYNKKKLIDIIQYLEITNKEIQKYLGYPSNSINIKTLGIEQLVDIVEKHMNKKYLVIR
jgi:superfamily II DNA or RNA helicase